MYFLYFWLHLCLVRHEVMFLNDNSAVSFHGLQHKNTTAAEWLWAVSQVNVSVREEYMQKWNSDEKNIGGLENILFLGWWWDLNHLQANAPSLYNHLQRHHRVTWWVCTRQEPTHFQLEETWTCFQCGPGTIHWFHCEERIVISILAKDFLPLWHTHRQAQARTLIGDIITTHFWQVSYIDTHVLQSINLNCHWI